MDNLLTTAIQNMQKRLQKLSLKEKASADSLVAEDFAVDSKGLLAIDELDSLFTSIVGCETIKRKMSEMRNLILGAKKDGKDPKKYLDFNFLFIGPPG